MKTNFFKKLSIIDFFSCNVSNNIQVSKNHFFILVFGLTLVSSSIFGQSNLYFYHGSNLTSSPRNVDICTQAVQSSDWNAGYAFYKFEFSLASDFTGGCEYIIKKSEGPALINVPCLEYDKIYYARIKTSADGLVWSTSGPVRWFTAINNIRFKYCSSTVSLTTNAVVANDWNASHHEYRFEFSQDNFTTTLCSYVIQRSQGPALISVPELDFGSTYQVRVCVKAHSTSVFSSPGPICNFNTGACSNTMVSANITKIDEQCSLSNGSANATASGGYPPYCYLWNNGGTNNSISGLIGGAYNVTITDSKKCQANKSVTVANPTPAPSTANAGVDQNACSSTIQNLSAVTPLIGTGTWSIVSGSVILANVSSPTSEISGLVSGASTILRWTVSNSNCSSSYDEVTINNGNSTVSGITLSDVYVKLLANSIGSYAWHYNGWSSTTSSSRGIISRANGVLYTLDITYNNTTTTSCAIVPNLMNQVLTQCQGNTQRLSSNTKIDNVKETKLEEEVTKLNSKNDWQEVTNYLSSEEIANTSNKVISNNITMTNNDIVIDGVLVKLCANGVGIYAWYVNGGSTIVSSSGCIVVPADGSSYAVDVINGNCTTTTCVTVPDLRNSLLTECNGNNQRLANTTEINSIHKVELVEYSATPYTNSNTGLMTIDFTALDENAQLTILDLNGKTKYSKAISKGTNTIQIDEPNLGGGIYLYRIVSASYKKIIQGKFVVE